MKLPTSVRYAVRVLFELHKAKGPLPIALLSEKTGVTFRAIENLHTVLRQNGITTGVLGARGGLTLTVPLEKVSLGKLVALLDNGVEFSVCCGERANECPHQDSCAVRALWRGVSSKFQKALDGVSLASILHPSSDAAPESENFFTGESKKM